jgi:hypothetical protein
MEAVMRLAAWLVWLAAFAAPAAAADAPRSLTGWRGDRGIFLSWSETGGAFTLWRGTESGRLSALLTVPPGQSGFLDLAARRDTRYVYALGDARSHGDAVEFPAAPAGARILAGLVTTCSGLQKGGLFPADTQNWFFPSRNAHVQFYGYYLIRPFGDAPREAKLVWRDPAGAVLSEYTHPITPKRVDLPEGPAGQVLLAQAIGLREALPQNGQRRVPASAGLYTVEAFIDGVPVSVTVWYLRSEAPAGGTGRGAPPAAPAVRPLPPPALEP